MRTRIARARLVRRFIAAIGVISALVGIVTFATGLVSLEQVWQSLSIRWIRFRASSQPQPRSSRQARPETLGRIQARVELAVADYNNIIERVTAGRGSVEQAFVKVRELEQLLVWERAEDDVSMLERMSEIELAQFAQRLPGLRVWCYNTVGVEIDPAFFQDLAERHGTEADSQFLRNYRLTYPRGYGWPDYVEPLTDLSGCTKYGGGELTNAYARWSTYTGRFPGHYAADTRRLLEEISSNFVKPVCACADANSVIKELSSFVTRFPSEPITPAVTQQLKAIASGQTEMRFNCRPG